MYNVVHLFNLDSTVLEKELSRKGQTKSKLSRAHRSISFSNKSTAADYEIVACTFVGGCKLSQSCIDDRVKSPVDG